MTRRVIVRPYDPAWPEAFRAEAARIAAALADLQPGVEHIGSTSVPGLAAKPTIDIVLLVNDLHQLDQRSSAMQALGYEVMGEYGILGRRYFRKLTAEGVHTHHVHAFQQGSMGADRHLAFRDYLRAHAAIARQYGQLKLRQAAAHPNDIEAYMDGKDPFIKDHEARALAWWKRGSVER